MDGIGAKTTLNEILRRYPEAVRVLNALGLDTCCGGAEPLEEAARKAGQEPEAVLKALAVLGGMDLLARARYGAGPGAEVLADHPEVRLVLFSLQKGQAVRGKGEPRVYLLCLEGEGVLWAGGREVRATPGTLLGAEPGEAHGAKAGEGRFLVLGLIAPRP